jgi:H+/Cl- antiporter ClcA
MNVNRTGVLVATILLLVTSHSLAEGIALGNPLAGANVSGLFGTPIAGTLVLAVFMLFGRETRRTLLTAVVICAAFAGTLFLIALGGMSNPAAVIFLVVLVVSPWLCFIVFIACFVVGLRRASARHVPSHLRSAAVGKNARPRTEP